MSIKTLWDWRIGDRVEIPAWHDMWVKGARYGTVVGFVDGKKHPNLAGARPIKVKLDKAGIARFAGADLRALDGPRASLDAIHRLMDGAEWSPDTLDDIAAILATAGYSIGGPK